VSRRSLSILVGAALAASLASSAVVAQDAAKPKIAFLPGVEDPFYHRLEAGIQAAAKDFGLDIVVAPYPATWGASAQTPELDALVSRGDLNYIITAPVSSQEMIAPLQNANDKGIKIVDVDTFIGDGNYVDGPVTFPVSYIGTDNVEGGRVVGEAMAKALGGKGKVYIQNTNKETSSVAQRSQGFREAIAKYPDMQVVDEQYSLDVQATAAQQTAAVLQKNPDLAGIFGVNVFSAAGAGSAVKDANLTGAVQVAAYDATKDAINFLKDGTVTMVLAQKPYDMGYIATEFAMADTAGVTSLPKRVTTGFEILTKDNVDDPNYSKYIYQ
jgi:ribose transport system substrate-binding protein